jgi:hypothetical protein
MILLTSMLIGSAHSSIPFRTSSRSWMIPIWPA